MQLRYSGIFGRWYNWNYDHRTRNFCTYFWGSLWALLWLPLTIASIWCSNAEGLLHRVLLGLVTWILLIAAATLFFTMYLYPWSYLKFTGIAVGILVLGALIVGLGAWLYNTDTWDEAVNIIATKKDSIKNKYCPKIDWV